ncbi:hypothetical protein ACOMCU_08375 [Lysinibacillus sp. UGB7]|uniref:hypothetical protein n=1 Tax=Lysinibacillus sp. UGB7 TaxID=3411039 RepID=UPI003B7EAD76
MAIHKVEFPYDSTHKELFFRLENFKWINICKNISIVFFVIYFTILISFKIHYKIPKIAEIEEDFFNFILIGTTFLLYNFICFLQRYISYSVIKKATNDIYQINKRNLYISFFYVLWSSSKKYFSFKSWREVLNFLKNLVSPDLFFSKFFKHELTKNKVSKDNSQNELYYSIGKNGENYSNIEWCKIKIERKFFIEWTNWLNILITVLSVIISVSLFYFCSENSILIILIWFLIFRMISRGIEISIAFYSDVVQVQSQVFKKSTGKVYSGEVFHQNDKYDINNHILRCNNGVICEFYGEELTKNIVYIDKFKSSILRSEARISLAMHTLVELFYLYSAIYIFCDWAYGLDNRLEVISPLKSLLISMSLGVFNISYSMDYNNLIIGIIHVSQVFLSVVLILLSLAQYLSKSDNINENEYENRLYSYVYLNTKKKKNKLNDYYHSNDGIKTSNNLKTYNNLSEIIVEVGETDNSVVELHFKNKGNDMKNE